MKIVEIPVGAVGVDMYTPLAPSEARALAAYTIPGTRTGFTFVERYPENLIADELSDILACGLGVMLVGESRPVGWLPNAALGTEDGDREVARTRALAIPTGITITCDLEGMVGTSQDTIAYANAWCGRVRQDIPMGYIGDLIPLSPMQLYALPFTRYQRSLSNVQPVSTVDYCVIQAFPTQTLHLVTGSLLVDFDFVQRDKRMRLPTMVIAD